MQETNLMVSDVKLKDLAAAAAAAVKVAS